MVDRSQIKEAPEGAWHNLADTEVVRLLGADPARGLTLEEVARRRLHFGPNQLSSHRGLPGWRRFLLQFNQALVYILVVAGTVTLALGEWVDSAVIFGVVLINAVMGYLQESKAEKAIEALSRMVRTESTVLREGRKVQVPSEDLVPGDLVWLQSGDRVPADLRLIRNKSLQVDESALTGESVPVSKQTGHLGLNTLLADRRNLAFAGTLVTHGQAEGLVWAIGNQTETGRIARLITTATNLTTPLTRKIQQFSGVLLWVILALAGVAFGVGLLRGESAVHVFMAAVALSVGAIPEGLPAAVTITLAIGVNRMAQRRAIIRKLPAVETLGSTTIICSDKTGTLTENQMTVQAVHAGGVRYEITGSGYGPEGEVLLDGHRLTGPLPEPLRECLLAGCLCNDSQLSQVEGLWKVQGDPTEAALTVAAGKAGISLETHGAAHGRLDSIPFESEDQFMATLHHHPHPEHRIIFKKGAVEKVMGRCRDMLGAEGTMVALDEARIRAEVEAMAGRGLRVLAFARRLTHSGHELLEPHHVAEGMTFVGLVGMMDPPRREAIESVRKCREAGIQVKMITGDHVATSTAVARQLGLGNTGRDELVAVTSSELDQTPDGELPALAERATVFARVAPEQKLKLVRALQQRGHIVAMTGDGVNDAPALKQADIGVAMGRSGTEVAKGAADMLLTDDNFASIEAAVEEGRGVFDNLTKFIVWTLPTNMGEGLILLAAILLGTALPVQPVHILWINMSTAIFLGLMLVFEPKEADLMQRPPRAPDQPILTPPLVFRTVLVSCLMLAGAFGLFLYERRVLLSEVALAQTVVMNVVVMVEMVYLLNCRSLWKPLHRVGLLSNPWIYLGLAAMGGAQLALTYVPVCNRLLHTAPIDGDAWLRIFAVGLAAGAIVELDKAFGRRRLRAGN